MLFQHSRSFITRLPLSLSLSLSLSLPLFLSLSLSLFLSLSLSICLSLSLSIYLSTHTHTRTHVHTQTHTFPFLFLNHFSLIRKSVGFSLPQSFFPLAVLPTSFRKYLKNSSAALLMNKLSLHIILRFFLYFFNNRLLRLKLCPWFDIELFENLVLDFGRLHWNFLRNETCQN